MQMQMNSCILALPPPPVKNATHRPNVNAVPSSMSLGHQRFKIRPMARFFGVYESMMNVPHFLCL